MNSRIHNMNGIFILNKPMGMSSQQAVTKVKRLLGAKKAGHGGTLDPDATGVLPIFLNQATRLAEFGLAGSKEYVAVATFGFSTDTQDASGTVIEQKDPSHLKKEDIEIALKAFIGQTEQVPPVYSALKINGKPAYELARSGVIVQLQPRMITVDSITIEEILTGPEVYSVRFKVACAKGTYIRTICNDLGQSLGVPAHMSALIRTKAGPFYIDQAYSLEQIRDVGWDLILPPERAVDGLSMIQVDSVQADKIMHGQTVSLGAEAMNHLPAFNESLQVRVHHETHGLLAIANVLLVAGEGLLLRPQKVFLNTEVGT